MKLTTSAFTIIAIVLAGGSFAFSSNECSSGFYRHSCVDGICGDMVPLECFQEHIDSSTQVALLDQPIPIKDTKQAEQFIAQGYDIECPFTVNSNNSCQAINPISIFQLHYPQEWPSPLDIFFEQLIPFPQIYYSVSWRGNNNPFHQYRPEHFFCSGRYSLWKGCTRFLELAMLFY